MTTENKSSLPPCIETPLVINAARETEGFEQQSQEAQEAIFSFVGASIDLIRKEDEVSEKAIDLSWERVKKSGADEILAVKVALRAAFRLPEELGNQW